MEASASAAVNVRLTGAPLKSEARNPSSQTALTILFRPDPTVWDGAYANNGWLQELSKPLTKLTWDNAALIAPATAQRLGVTTEDVVELSSGAARSRPPCG